MARNTTAVPSRHERFTTSSIDHWRSRHDRIHLDIGTGDAGYAVRIARRDPGLGVIGVDTNLDNVRVADKRLPPNLRLLANDGRAVTSIPGVVPIDRVTVNFPYGSLLTWLVDDAIGAADALTAIASPGGAIEIRINDSALREIGMAIETAANLLRGAFWHRPAWIVEMRDMQRDDLRRFPSTWARRIGSGRPTTALELIARHTG